ncbi:MAG: hypothetical protein ACM32O_04100 [Clostridia bacterium]
MLCPVCNALQSISSTCPLCDAALQDTGRLADYYGDYSPYREIDDAKGDNGFPDLSLHLCIHVTWCPQCHIEQLIGVSERLEP